MKLVGLMALGACDDAIVANGGGHAEVIDVDAEPSNIYNDESTRAVKRVAEVVSLLSEDEEAERQQRRKRRRKEGVQFETVVLDDGNEEGGHGGEVEVVTHVIREGKEGRRAEVVSEEWADGCGEVVCTGSRRGVRALRDYPHFRFQCEVVEERLGMTFCGRCFCYVCDLPAGECREWRIHCGAVEDGGQWRRMREMKLRARSR